MIGRCKNNPKGQLTGTCTPPLNSCNKTLEIIISIWKTYFHGFTSMVLQNYSAAYVFFSYFELDT